MLFNDGHVLQLRSKIVPARRRMNMVLDDDDQMISWDECAQNFLIFVLELTKPPEIDQTRKRTRARWVRDNDVIGGLASSSLSSECCAQGQVFQCKRWNQG